MLRIERIREGQGELLKGVRCRALEEAPYAFSSTLEGALQRSDESWARECAEGSGKALFVATWEGEPCGLMGCVIVGEGEEADLFSVWVAPEFRRQKVAAQMLAAVKEWARENGGRVLHAWVAEKNLGAIRFYRSFGLIETGRRELIRAGSEEQQILMAGPLS